MNNNELKILPLGGCQDIGMNLMIFETSQDIIIVDVGIGFTENNTYGVDTLIADFDYLKKHKRKIRALFISHGHEDHLGATPFLLNELPIPIYATSFPAELIIKKCSEDGINPDIVVINQMQEYTVGSFTITLFPVDHSIVETSGLKISVLGKTITFMSDFKIADNKKQLLTNIKELGLAGSDILFSDSTNIDVGDWTKPEKDIEPDLRNIVKECKGKILFTTFASNTVRLQTAMKLAKEFGRKVFLMGRSMHLYTEIANRLGHLKLIESDLEKIENVSSFPDEKVFIIATGSQGENRSAVKRLSLGEMKMIDLTSKDTILFSSKIIPGNETAVRTVIDDLARLDVNVFYENNARIHVSGHASRPELEFAINSIKPKNFIPVHGEYRFLKSHVKLALKCGMTPKNVRIVENGQEVFLTDTGLTLGKRHDIQNVALDFINQEPISEEVLRERKKIAKTGVLFILAHLNKMTFSLIGKPIIHSKAFSSGILGEVFFNELVTHLGKKITEFAQKNENSNGTEALENFVVKEVRNFTNLRMKFKPITICEIVLS
jgi:ribonuclease J